MAQIGTEVQEFQNATDVLDDAAAQLLGLNRTDQRCLGVLFVRGAMTAGKLADAAALSPGAMTAVLDRLERAGYVRRVREKEDRRRILVEVTSEARRRAEELYGPIAADGFERMREASTDDLRTILDFLRDARELQDKHAARIRGMLPPRDVRTEVKAAARGAKAAMKEAKAVMKETTKPAARSVRGDTGAR
jgi:DNA-binding MarR family transcriptional regulator